MLFGAQDLPTLRNSSLNLRDNVRMCLSKALPLGRPGHALVPTADDHGQMTKSL